MAEWTGTIVADAWHLSIIEKNLVSLCFIQIYKISFDFLYLSSYGKVRWSRLADVQ